MPLSSRIGDGVRYFLCELSKLISTPAAAILSAINAGIEQFYSGVLFCLSLHYRILTRLWSCLFWLATLCCPCFWFMKIRKHSAEPVNTDQPSARDAVNNYLDDEKNRNKYLSPTEMNCLGSRLHKYWYKSQMGKQKEDVLITAALVSQNCRLKLNTTTIQGINELLAAFTPHPFLHRVLEVSYDRDFQHIVIVQEYVSEGSLKDMIYKKADADADWSEKYRQRSKGLPNKTIMLYGRHILEAMLYLYRQGLPYHQLGHVQTGNVFIGPDNICRLGGYENTLFGYKTRLFRLCRCYEDRIDIVMFGHLLFEMCCGYELTTISPKKQEYKSVKDRTLKATLQYIFEDGFPHSIEEISQKESFKDQLNQQIELPKDLVLSQKCQHLLKQLKTSSPQQQDPAQGVRKRPPSIVRFSD